MGIPVRELKARITSAELVNYMASYQLERRGGHYDDLRAGAIAAVIGNVNRNRKERKKPFTPLDFAPWNEYAQTAAEEKPVLLKDRDAQSNLILAKMFPNRNG